MELLSTASFKLNIEKQRDFDIDISVITRQLNLYDILLNFKLPIMKEHDILITPFINVNVENYDNFKKGETTSDLLLFDSSPNDASLLNVNLLARNFQYYINYSEEQKRPFGFLDEYKPFVKTQPINVIFDEFNQLKKINNYSVADNETDNNIMYYTKSILLFTYRIKPQYLLLHPRNIMEYYDFYDINNLLDMGTTNTTNINTTNTNVVSFLYFQIRPLKEGVYSFSIDGTNIITLEIDGDLILNKFNNTSVLNNTNINTNLYMTTKLYTFVIRFENTNQIGNVKLQFKPLEETTWRIFDITNTSPYFDINTYIPPINQYKNIDFVINPSTYHIIHNISFFNSTDEIYIKPDILNSFKSTTKLPFVFNMAKNVTPITEIDPLKKGNVLNDNITAFTNGHWESDLTDIIPSRYIGYDFTNTTFYPNQLYAIEISETSYMGSDYQNLSNNIYIRIYVEYAPNNIGYIEIHDTQYIDFENSRNISYSIDVDNMGIRKINPFGITTIVLNDRFRENFKPYKITRMLIYRGDIYAKQENNIKEKWENVTELAIYKCLCKFEDIYQLVMEDGSTSPIYNNTSTITYNYNNIIFPDNLENYPSISNFYKSNVIYLSKNTETYNPIVILEKDQE
jgi:hypothetical protein